MKEDVKNKSINVPPIEENPEISEILEILGRCASAHQKGDKREAAELYNQAKKMFEDKNLTSPKLVEQFYSLSVAIEKSF